MSFSLEISSIATQIPCIKLFPLMSIFFAFMLSLLSSAVEIRWNLCAHLPIPARLDYLPWASACYRKGGGEEQFLVLCMGLGREKKLEIFHLRGWEGRIEGKGTAGTVPGGLRAAAEIGTGEGGETKDVRSSVRSALSQAC